jgi:hypothetical protein
MILQINKGSSLKNAQRQFNAYYPYLKLEFFKRIPTRQPMNKILTFSSAELVRSIDPMKREDVHIDVGRKKTISDVEDAFEKSLGISAHVFRRSGNVWVETTLTNDWSLEDQNEEGKQISSHFIDPGNMKISLNDPDTQYPRVT